MTEREPRRHVDLQNPNEYNGCLGAARSCLWLTTDRVWNVNGAVFKADGNFLNHFFMAKIGATPVTLGSYPARAADLAAARDAGITAILNLMDRTDHRMHAISNDDYLGMTLDNGIPEYRRSAVNDDCEHKYAASAFQACLHLDQIVNQHGM
jgi:hypothetical protein